ncbi:MAG: ABC transporter ATP-binding protein [Gammaproteobacteria bacterium]|nr:ABC transporter ATP-binding protein [Gammaproteobacteria bacterium]
MTIQTPIAYVLRHRGRVIRIAGWSVGVTLAPMFTGRAIASAMDAASSGALAVSFMWLAGLLGAGAVGVLSLMRLSRLAADISADVQTDLTRDVVRHALADAVGSDRVLRSGAELIQHVPVLVDVLSLMLRTAPAGLFAIGAVAGLATLSGTLLILVVPWLAVSVFLLAALVRRDTRNQRAVTLASEASYGEMAKAIQGVRDLMAAGAKGYAMGRVRYCIEAANRLLLKQGDQNAVRSGLVNATSTWLPALTALAFVPTLVRNGSLTPGEVVGSFTYLLAGLAAASTFVTSVMGYVVTLRVRHGRLVESVGEDSPTAREDVDASPRTCSTIQVRDLTFSYGASAQPIVDGLRLDIPHGDHLAIVGPSGIGKSTLAALFAGVLAPDSGSVEVAGAYLHLRGDRTGLVTMVPQEAYVFAGSLRDNLTYLRPSASDEELATSAQAVGLERVLDRLGGFDAQIDLAKSGLSAGEKQLVTLARAHLAATPIVVLDEATCHLDPAAEERAERAFMSTGSTLIVVAHRMSATLRAKRVMVMGSDGIDVGDHTALMQRHALYTDFHGMWSAPMTEQSE